MTRYDFTKPAPQLIRTRGPSTGAYAAFTDESAITGHRYMLVGGVSCLLDHAQRVHETVWRIRARSPYGDSLQWKHLTAKKLSVYKELVDFFLEENARQRLDFTCLIVDTAQFNHAVFNDGDGETAFQKIMYQLYTSLVRKYGRPESIRGFHGQRSSRYTLDEVAGIINAGAAKRTGRAGYAPLTHFEYMDVSASGPHQIADVLLGAVAHHWNPGQRKGGSLHKAELARYVQAECCADSLTSPTPHWQPHFDLWKFRLRDPQA